MTVATADFKHSSAPEPHRARTKEILRAHPDIRKLIGPDPATFWWTLGVVTLQFIVAWACRDSSWWVVFLLAYTVGAFANHGLFVLIHECTHKLVFKRKTPNFITGLLANMPLFFPSIAPFQKYHLKHHAFQGVYELDADVPSHWEARLIGHSWFGKACWFLLYPLFQALRPMRMKEVPVMQGLEWINLGVQVATNLAVWFLFGPKALAYLAMSFFFSIGLHPLGARWIQRHYLTDEGEQETFSYYGFLNAITFNVGYHNEHHDFPSVPWTRLPKIKQIAPEYYVDLKAHMSWTRLLFQFLFDRKLSLFSRMVREERNKVNLSDEVRPDLDLIEGAKPVGANQTAVASREALGTS